MVLAKRWMIYLSKRRFGSYIYKKSSTRNRNLLQYNSTAEQMNRARTYQKRDIQF